MSDERDDPEDAALRALFAELRARDASAAPTFDATLAAASSRRPRRVLLPLALAGGAACALAAAAALVFALLYGREPAFVDPLVGVAEPEPTAFLLRRPELPGETP